MYGRIVVVGHCCAGVPQAIADKLDTELVLTRGPGIDYKANKQINIGAPWTKYQKLTPRFFSIPRFMPMLEMYDTIHFHKESFLPMGLDISYWKAKGKMVLIHFHGSEIRGKEFKMKIGGFRRADRVFVSTPDLLRYAPDAVWIPNPIDLSKIEFIPTDTSRETLRITHMPTNRKLKGSDLIHQAILELKTEGEPIEYAELRNLGHDDALKEIGKADLVIDQVNPSIGMYGLISCEAMACGKPVICSLRDEYDEILKDCPILPVRSVGTKEIKEKIRNIIEDTQLRKELGLKGRRYVEETHGISKITERMYGRGRD